MGSQLGHLLVELKADHPSSAVSYGMRAFADLLDQRYGLAGCREELGGDRRLLSPFHDDAQATGAAYLQSCSAGASDPQLVPGSGPPYG